MSQGITFDPTIGRITIVNGTRVVETTDGTLINMLPTLETLTQVLSYPDIDKGMLYAFNYDTWYDHTTTNGGRTTQWWNQQDFGATWSTILPQEHSQKTVLMAAPPSADCFLGRIRINRTVAPTHTYMGNITPVLPPQNVWLPLTGSILMEADVAMARALHIYIDTDQNLVAELQWSGSVPPANYGIYRTVSTAEEVAGGNNRWQVGSYTQQGSPIYKIQQTSTYQQVANDASVLTDCDYGGSKACSIVDPTFYGDTYSIDLEGYFGRRS